MSNSVKAKKTNDRDGYWSGMFTGVFLGCFFISLIILIVLRVQGLKIAVNPDLLAGIIKSKVQTEARKGIPELLEGIKQELPNEINNNMSGLDDFTIGIGKSQVKLPEEVLTTLKGEFNRIMEEAVINTLNDYNTTKYEEQIGQNVYELVGRMLRQEVIGKTYLIKTSPWFSVPIKIVGTTKDNLRIGI